jgi:hypothetical protein
MDTPDSRLAPPTEPASADSASPFNPRPDEAADRLAFEPVPLRYRSDGLTARKQREFVEALADCGIVREAAARVGVTEQAIARVRRRSDARSFDRACEAAQVFGARRLRSIAYERAVEGTLKGHYFHGELVSQERVYDNRLLTYLLGKTGNLLEPSAEAVAVCDDWERHMDALEQGLQSPDPARSEAADGASADDLVEIDEEDAQVWLEDGVWWTFFPPPDGFDGEEEGDTDDGDYRRTLSDDEQAAMKARNRALNEVELARCCAVRDRFFRLPPRGWADDFLPKEAETSETSEPGEGESGSPTRHPGEGLDP